MNTVRLGRIAGIQVGAQWSALVVAFLMALVLANGVLPSYAPGRTGSAYWSIAIPTALAFLAGLLAHELAHSLVALRKGVAVKAITLWMLGGMSELESEAPSPGAELQIAVAGPLTSLALGILVSGGAFLGDASHVSPLLVGALVWLGIVNLFLGVFNLLPGAPLDGGRVLRALLWRRYHDRTRADLAAARAGRMIGAVVMVGGAAELLVYDASAGLWTVVVGWFLTAAARSEENTRIVRQALRGLRAADIMTPRPDLAPAWQFVGQFTDQTLVSRQQVFPVVDFDGSPVGAVTAGLLARLPAQSRSELRLRAVMRPIDDRFRCEPGTPAEEVVGHGDAYGLVAVVLDGPPLVGMITTEDLSRTIQTGLLRPRDRAM
jgi:Zn-dependent protease/CBS domain-containing protein